MDLTEEMISINKVVFKVSSTFPSFGRLKSQSLRINGFSLYPKLSHNSSVIKGIKG